MSSEYDPNIKIKSEPGAEPPLHAENGNTICATEGADKNLEFVSIKMELDFQTEEANVKKEASYEVPLTADSSADSAWRQTKHDPEDAVVKTEYIDQYQGEESSYLVPAITQPNSSQVCFDSDAALIDEAEKTNTCPMCQKTFANPGNVRRHLLIHARVKHKCDVCSKQFLKQDQLERHLSRHDRVAAHDCDECGKCFKTPSKLKQHSLTHSKDKPYFCKQCHRSFSTEPGLVKHQGRSRCRRPIDEPLSCHVCFKTFEKEFLLKSHLRRHDSVRPFACDLCGMSFKYKSTIVRHIRWHNGIKPFSCKVCKKSFTQAGLLKPHMRVHTGERPYQCHICLKTFSYKHNMLRHTARHSKVKRLVCEICNKQFPRESRLIYHMRIHLDEKRFFSCFVCPKKFSHRQNVLRHYMRKHPGHTYDCTDTDAQVALRVWDKVKNTFLNEPEEILG